MSEKSGSSGGISLSSLLLVAFIVLKLCGVIAWSWWWVLSPLWISILIILGVVSVMVTFAVVKS